MELNDILTELGEFSYSSIGFPAFMLYCHEGKWSCWYRNAFTFKNPKIEADTPLEACRQMKEFLKGLHDDILENPHLE